MAAVYPFKEFARIFNNRLEAVTALRNGAFRAPRGLALAFNKKRVLGLAIFAVMLGLFLTFNRVPKLDIVEEDMVAATAETTRCFQGFCLESKPNESFISGWWKFSLTYLELVAAGMIFAILAAGITEAFLFPGRPRPVSPEKGSGER